MAARADFACLTCLERWELPLKAEHCPDETCGGELARIWDAVSAPNVGRGATPQTHVDTLGYNSHEKAKLVDALVEPQWEKAQKLKNHKPEFKTSPLSPGQTYGGLPGDARAWSRAIPAPLVNSLPFPGSERAGGPPIRWNPPQGKPQHITKPGGA